MLEFLEDAAVELELAVAWYDTQRPGLGAEFLDALRATVQYAEDAPKRQRAQYPHGGRHSQE